MSVHISSKVWEAPMAPTKKLIMLSLADQANDEGVTWPSVRSLARRTGLSPRAIQKNLAELEADKIIVRERRQAATGRQTSNFFTISISALPTLHDVHPCTSDGGRVHLGRGEGAPATGGRVHDVHPLNHHKEPPTEPSQETSTGEELFCMEEKEPELAAKTTPLEQLRAAWNQRVIGLRKVTAISGKRKALTQARFADLDHSLPAWEKFCDMIEASDFLTGRNPGNDGRRWTADFDWCILPTNFAKIREGKYSPKPKPDAQYW